MYKYIHTYTYICTYIHIHTYIWPNLLLPSMSCTRLPRLLAFHIYIHICIYVYLNIYIYTFVYAIRQPGNGNSDQGVENSKGQTN